MATPGHQVLSRSLDRSSDRPVFQQIADHLREAISAELLSPGDMVPSETQLADHYGVTRPTARHALDVLKTEGLVVAEHGRGSFVRQRPVVRRLASDRFARHHRERGKAAFLAEVEHAGAKPVVDQLTVSEGPPTADAARRLQLGEGDTVVTRDRRYLIDGQPVEFAISYIPSRIAQGTEIAQENPGPGGIYGRLEDLGHRLDYFEEEVHARAPTPDEARRLALPAGVPVPGLATPRHSPASCPWSCPTKHRMRPPAW